MTPDATRGPSRIEILDRVREIASEQEGVPIEEVFPGSDLERDLGMDSLARVEFAMTIEEAFGVELADEEADRIRTVGEAAETVLALLVARPRVPPA